MRAGDEVTAAEVERLLGELTLDEKCSLTAGASLWYLPPVERLGIPALKVSDGPSGVRGDSLMGRRSLSLPCGMAVGSTWDVELAGRLGQGLAAEARSKGVHVLLGPTVCLPRTPLAGRTFESFSEDPVLTAQIAVAYVGGVQDGGVACCIKHYACNDQEHERMTISAELDERALREVHLVAFEAAVREAGVMSVMTAYNKVRGLYCCEQPHLIGDVLRGEWGFEGVVMSDWFGTHSTAPAARAGLDLEMPGPPTWFGPNLAAAVRDGTVDEAVVDGQVRHVLRLMASLGLIDGSWAGSAVEQEEDDPDRRALAREVAAAGTVLLANRDLLPLDASSVGRVAVIGPNARHMAMGGGSSEVTPHRRHSVAEALADRLPNAEVVFEVGCRIDKSLPAMDMRLLDGEAWRVDFFEGSGQPDHPGKPVSDGVARSANVRLIGSPQPGLDPGRYAVRISGTFTPDASGRWVLGLESAGRSELRLDGAVVLDNGETTRGKGFYGFGSEPVQVEIELEAGKAYGVAVDVWPLNASWPVLGARIGTAQPVDDGEFDRAVEAAGRADAAVVVVGLNAEWESEGFDRPDLALPGRQAKLVEAVCEANPRTVVVVNAGSPVEMPWAEQAGAVLVPWYAGEEGADALAEILVGSMEPGGRLPITWPRRLPEVEARVYPGVDGQVFYEEGIGIGYRGGEVDAQFCFGHGMGYGRIEWGDVEITAERVVVELRNVGERRGTEVVQVYLRALDAPVPMPERALAGYVKVALEAGRQHRCEVELDAAGTQYWDVDSVGWKPAGSRFEVLVGASSQDIRAAGVVTR
jgi:beta-glucosidase